MSKKQQHTKTNEAKGYKTELASGVSHAEIVELLERIGTKQGGMQVRCKLLDGSDAGKVMRRNVLGPVRAGDILLLRETEIEAPPARGRRSNG